MAPTPIKKEIIEVSDFLHWWTTERAGVAVALAAVVIAVPSILSARRDRRERDRPHVVVELRLGEIGTHSLLLVTKNYGVTVAREIGVSFEPDLPDPEPDQLQGSMTPFIKRRYARPIPTLSPGQELVQVYTDVMGGDTHGVPILRDNVPAELTATVICQGPDGHWHTDKFALSANVFVETTWSQSSSSPAGRMKQAIDTIKRLDVTLKSIDRSLKKIANGDAGD